MNCGVARISERLLSLGYNGRYLHENPLGAAGTPPARHPLLLRVHSSAVTRETTLEPFVGSLEASGA
jgi:hypothetical protein